MKGEAQEPAIMTIELTKEFAAELAQQAVKFGASAAEVIIRQHTDFSVGVRLGDVEKLQQSTDKGFGLRVLLEGKQASVSGSDFSDDAIQALLKEAIELVKNTSPDDSAGLPEQEEFATTFEDLDLFDEKIDNLTTDQKISLALRAEEAARAYSPLIVNFEGGGFDCSSGSMI